MLAECGLELNRIELTILIGERHDGALGLKIKEDREAASLQIEIDYCDTLVEGIAEREREIGREAGYTCTANQANQRNDRAALIHFFAAAGLTDLKECAGSLA